MDINQVRNLNANLSKNYSTHMGVLINVLMHSKGDVIECGGGPFSTPMLHWLCKLQGRRLITYENHPDYHAFERQFQSQRHSVRLVEDWDKIDTTKRVGVVFIDHHPPERRMVELERFKDSADYIVIHDTERVSREYNRDEVFTMFKYRHDWKDCKPWTSVLSNSKDLSKLFS